MNDVLLVGAGGFLGASGRYLVSKLINQYWPKSFPLATFVVNIVGSFVLGLAVAHPDLLNQPTVIHYGLGIGFLGSFTTYSTFSFEVLRLVEDKKVLTAVLYVALSFAIGFFLAWAAGHYLYV